MTSEGRTPSQAMCELRYEGNECHRPEGHSGLCYDERTRVAFEDGWWGDDKGNSGRTASSGDRLVSPGDEGYDDAFDVCPEPTCPLYGKAVMADHRHLSGRTPSLPHDPANGLTVRTPGNPCNRGCPGDWPCAERKAQRLTSREIVDYLRSDLYKPVPDDTGSEQEGNLWESPLGWRVWVSYGERGMLGLIYDPDGGLHSSTTYATAQWLGTDLP